MAYQKHTWVTGEPITQERMNNMEDGIANAHISTNANTTLINGLDTTVSTVQSDISDIKSNIQALQQNTSDVNVYSKEGHEAWNAVLQAATLASGTPAEGNVVFSKTLDGRFGDIETDISNIRTEIQDAHRNSNDTLDKRFDDFDSRLSGFNTAMDIINDKFASASNSSVYGGYGSVDDRLEADETKISNLSREIEDTHQSTALRSAAEEYASFVNLVSRLEEGERRIVAAQAELNNAHSSDAIRDINDNPTSYASLNARFEAIEGELVGATSMSTRLDTLDNNISNLSANKVNKTDVENNLLTQDSVDKHALDARQGRILKETIDDLDTAYKAADSVLDGRLDAIDGGSALDTTNGTLAARVSALETEVDMTSTDSRIDTALSRIEAMDNSSTGSIAGLDTRISALETTVDTSTTGLSDRMTEAENAISHAASGADAGGLTERLTVVETSITGNGGIEDRLDAIDDASTGAIKGLQDADLALDGRLDAIDGGSALDTTNGTLSARVTALEGKDTIIIDYDGEHSNYTSDEPNLNNPSVNADYLIADDNGKYFYWRYFGAEDGWQLVGGAGGGGNGSSSGVILTELPSVASGDPNIDYFIGTNVLGYIHYRFIAGEQEGTGSYIKILPNNLISGIGVNSVEIKANESTANEWPAAGTTHVSGGLNAYTLNDANQTTNLLEDFVAVRNARINATYEADGETLKTQTLQVLDTNGNVMEYPIVGGSGGGSAFTTRIETTSPISRSVPATSTDPVTITARVVMKQGQDLVNGAFAYGQIQYRVNGTSTWLNGDRVEVEAAEESMKYTIQNNVYFTVDVTKYLQTDKTMQIRLAIEAHPESEEESIMRYQTFNISKVNISISSENFDYWSVKDSNFVFNYRCFGTGITKIVHFLVDGVDAVTPVTTTTNNVFLSQAIPMTDKENGMHTFQVYFVTPTGLESNKLNYFILYNTDTSRQAPLIGAAAENTNIVDGDEIIVNYSVNTIGTEKTDSVEIELYTLDEHDVKQVRSTTTLTGVTNNQLASPPYRTFDYPSLRKASPNDPDPDPITVYVKLTATHNGLSNSQIITIEVRYLDTTYDLDAESNNLIFDYSAYGRSNNDANKSTYTYRYTKVNGQTIDFVGTFNNFNWATDGYVDGESLIIGGGATLNINVPIFNSKFNNISIEENENIEKITTNGRTIEIDYEVLSTTNMGATIIDCLTEGVSPKGFRVTPQNCYLLNSGSNVDIDETGFIKNEENVAAAYLNPGMRTHLTFVIEPISTTLAADNTYHQSANIYINGEFANSCPYNTVGNDFDNNATITIGSDTCLIKLYSIKLYNRGLPEAKVLHNYSVAPVATREKINRLEDNDILNRAGEVDYEKARKKYTCLLLTGMGTVNGVNVPTMAPYKGYPSVVGRLKDGEPVGKTESGLLLTKPTNENSNGYTVEFDLQDRLIDPHNQYGYASSNNVQGTSSQKFPVKNLKVYLAKGDDTTEMVFDTNETISVKKVYKYSINNAAKAAYQSIYPSAESLPQYIVECGENIATIVKNLDEVPTQAEVVTKIETYLNAEDPNVGAVYSTYSTGDELITHPIIAYKKSKKVKYALRENGIGESTLCWKADYMSTDHANTFNANIANTLYSTDDRLSSRWTDQTQYAVYGIKCLLFQQSGSGDPVFVGDGCLNNDKGNHTTFGLETQAISGVWPGDENNNTMCQKWDFRNNTNSLLFFKHDGLFQIVDDKPAAASCLECIYPDEGDLADEQAKYKSANNGATNPALDVNYNHFQILSSWLGNRANYWYETDASKRAAKKQIFIDEFRNHFNFNHILIYYLFMEYTALCDNRVKNIHMRTDNAGEEKIRIKNTDTYYFEGNSNPNSGPWTLAENLETRTMQEPIMDENGNYQFDQSGNIELGNINHVFVKDSVLETIDWQQGEGHSNFAIWAPVLYDLDSCFGAENVGYLKVRYDADWNYSLYDKLQFAGFDSILWLQVEDCFQTELKTMAKTLYNRATGLNYTTFYRQQIVDNLASLCPAITNQDMILKYEEPWTNGYLDYSQDTANPTISTDEYKYLQRGTRTAQKATFMKQRSMFLASKYDGNEFKQDKITFRAGTLVNQENAIITLTANQKLYHGVQYGDLNDVSKVTRRANKVYNTTNETWDDIGPDTWIPEFVPCRVQNIGDMGNTDGIEIYGASVLNDIGDLSRFHPYQIDVGKAINLKKLIIGSSTSGYSNTSTTKIDGLNSCTLLEEINVCNLKNLTALSLVNNGFIKKVYATGSGLNTLSLPRGGVLDTIAYGENTTDITIINQSRLTDFSYENSITNHYANVTRLWIENTPNVPVQEIITARLTARASADAGLRTGGLRVIGLNLDLGNDPSFLQLITSDLAKGCYLSASGSHIEGSTDYPTITGTIRITNIRQSLLESLNTIYPNLIINYTQRDDEYTVTYENWDETVLFIDHGISTDSVKDPVYDINPVTNAPYIEMPTKPQDVQYNYKFGTYDSQNKYRRFSGWVRKGTNTSPTSDSKITGTITYVAYYPTVETRQYTVRWFAEPNTDPILSYTEDYGTPIGSFAQPETSNQINFVRAKSVGNMVKVFKGWNRPVGKLTGNIDVYAQWETSTINGDTPSIIMDQLNAADIYAISSQVDAGHKDTLLRDGDHIGEPIMIRMGHDFDYTDGVTTTNLLGMQNKLIFDGTSNNIMAFNNIKPLSINQDWTLALDYKFLLRNAQFLRTSGEFILASCYQNANSSIQGFKLSLVKNSSGGATTHSIQVSWGTSTATIDYITVDNEATNDYLYCKSYRNMVVLSHNADTPTALNIYYVPPLTTNNNAIAGSDLGDDVQITTLNWANATLIETPLILGGNYNGVTTNIETSSNRYPAQGIIYWAKYWTADLGETNCKNLAAWPHEIVPFYLSGYNGQSGAFEQIYANSELSFVAAQGMSDRYQYVTTNLFTAMDENQEYAGWFASRARAICNNLIYKGMPTAYQSIIRKTLVTSAITIYTTSGVTTRDTEDYLFLPAEREVNASESGNQYVNDNEVQSQWTHPWHWMILGNLNNVYTVQGNSTTLILKSIVDDTYHNNYRYYRYRFSGHYIKPTARIFETGTTDPTNPNTTTHAWTYNSTSVRVQSGDIWINGDNVAYMYFTAEEIEEGESIDLIAAYGTGGWKRADIWQTRTFNVAAHSGGENFFMKIGYAGEMITPTRTSFIAEGRLLCPEFTI